MKVKRLVERLSKFNPEAEVKLNDRYGETALFVNALANDDSVVWIDGEDDIDMGSELSTRWIESPNVFKTDLEFYKDLLETGITVDMVRKYMGDIYANTMEECCKKYNLL